MNSETKTETESGTSLKLIRSSASALAAELIGDDNENADTCLEVARRLVAQGKSGWQIARALRYGMGQEWIRIAEVLHRELGFTAGKIMRILHDQAALPLEAVALILRDGLSLTNESVALLIGELP